MQNTSGPIADKGCIGLKRCGTDDIMNTFVLHWFNLTSWLDDSSDDGDGDEDCDDDDKEDEKEERDDKQLACYVIANHGHNPLLKTMSIQPMCLHRLCPGERAIYKMLKAFPAQS